MVAQLTTADMMQVAYNTGATGKPAPAWAQRDRGYARAYARGRQSAGLDTEDDAGDEQPAAPTTTPTKPAQRPAPRAPRSRPRARSRGRIPRGRRGGMTGWFTGRGGTGGGLLLAIFAYPIGLAVLQRGPAGAGVWFKAKFLNNETSAATPGNSGKSGLGPGGTTSGGGASAGGGGSW